MKQRLDGALQKKIAAVNTAAANPMVDTATVEHRFNAAVRFAGNRNKVVQALEPATRQRLWPEKESA